MVQTVGITKAITNLNEAHAKFNLSQTANSQFFTEWFEDLPELTDSEKQSLNRLKNRYLYYATDGAIAAGTVNIIDNNNLHRVVRVIKRIISLYLQL